VVGGSSPKKVVKGMGGLPCAVGCGVRGLGEASVVGVVGECVAMGVGLEGGEAVEGVIGAKGVVVGEGIA
jgi:hypothetical protein